MPIRPLSPCRLAALRRQPGMLVMAPVAETLAHETGARVAVLDPIEGLTDESAGDDYFEVMRANLSTLRAGQECR